MMMRTMMVMMITYDDVGDDDDDAWVVGLRILVCACRDLVADFSGAFGKQF